MSDVAISLLFIGIFFIVTIGIAVYSRRHTKSVGSFVLGGRAVGPWITAFAYGTTYFSAVVFIGYAGQFGWGFGTSAIWIGLGNAFLGSLLVWKVMGRRIRIMTKHLEATTMPEFFGKRYNSKPLKITACLIVFVFLIPYSASVFNGLSYLFTTALNLDKITGPIICIIVMSLITALYVILGGYMSAALNDFFQGIIMLGGIFLVIFSVLNKNGGLMDSLTMLSKQTSAAVPEMNGSLISMFGPEPLNLLGVIILTSLGAWGLPQMVHKFYTIKSEKAIQTGTVVSTVFALVIAGGSYFIGSFGRIFVTAEQITVDGNLQFDQIVPKMLEELGMPVLIAVVVVLVLSASMSTLASLVLTSSSTITLDLISGNIIKDMTEKKKVMWIRILLAIFILVSMLLAIYASNPKNPQYITKLMSISWGALAGSFLAPFLYGLFWKKVSKLAVWACFFSGVGITVTHLVLANGKLFNHDFVFPTGLPINLASPVNAGAFTMLFGLVLVPLVSLITPKIKKEVVDHAFKGYDIQNEENQKILASKKEVI